MPFKKVFGNFKSKAKKQMEDSKPHFDREDPPRRQVPADRPLVYQSRKYPEITVHEYPDRFELFRDFNDGMGLTYVKTEYKNNFK